MKPRALTCLVIIAAAFLATVLTGCEDRPCKKGHYEYITTYDPALKVPRQQPYWHCDVYEETQ